MRPCSCSLGCLHSQLVSHLSWPETNFVTTDRPYRQMAMKLRKDANLAPPVCRVQQAGNNDVDWIPYPRSNQITYITKPAQLPQVREGLAVLTNIMMEVQGLFYDERLIGNFEALLRKAEDSYKCLQRWLADWPDGSQVGKEPIPQLLILR